MVGWFAALNFKLRTLNFPLNHKPVHDYVDGMALLLVERRNVLQRVRGAVHAHSHEAGALDVGERLLVASLASLHHGRVDDELGAGWKLEERFDDLLGRLPAHWLAALGAVRHAHRSVEERR